MLVGNDISFWQGNINFDVYKNNSNFLIVKSSEGSSYIDPKFSRNQSEARRVGLSLGYYHFARPDLGNGAAAEADFFLRTIGTLRDDELLCLDYEPPNYAGDPVAWCKAFLQRISSQLNGYKPLIYLNQYQISNFNWKPVVDLGYGLWIAAYTGSPDNNNFAIGAWTFAAMQQWTSSQTVPGIAGAVDGNVFFGDLATLKKYGYHKVTVPPPTPLPDPCAAQNLQINQLTSALNNLTKERDDYKLRYEQAISKIEKAKSDLNG